MTAKTLTLRSDAGEPVKVHKAVYHEGWPKQAKLDPSIVWIRESLPGRKSA